MKAMQVSIITPAHNEEEIITSFVRNAVDFLREEKIDGEVIIIENGSNDSTLDQLRRLARKYPELRIENLPVADKGSALRKGLERARGENLITIDTDLWDDKFVLDSIRNLKNHDVVVGSRSIPGGSDQRPLSSRLLNWGYNFIFKLVFNLLGTNTHAQLSFRREKILPLLAKCQTTALNFDTELILRAEREKLLKIEVPTVVKEVRSRRYKFLDQLTKTVSNFFTLLKVLGPSPNWSYVTLLTALILGIFLRFYRYADWFFLSVDEEHYDYMTRMITINHHFPLIGGPISGTKLYMAPWYLYFNSIWFFVSHNNPLVSGVVTTLMGVATIWLIYLIGKRLFSPMVGSIGALLYAASFLIVIFDRHSWNISVAALASAFSFYALLRFSEGNRLWLIVAGLTVGFGMSSTFSVFAVFLFVLAAAVIISKGNRGKNILIFLGVITLIHLPIFFFDLRHNFWSERALWEFFTSHPYDATPLLTRIVNTIVLLFNSLAKSIVVTSPLDIADETSICTTSVMRFIPSVVTVIFAIAVLTNYFLQLISQEKSKTVWLPLLLLFVNIFSLFLFRADPSERHWLPFYPLFFLLLAFFLYRVATISKIAKYLSIMLVAVLVFVNVQALFFSWSSYGYADKDKAIKFIIANTQPQKFYLDSIGECHKWGYRYLFSYYNHEPAGSFLDYDFSWMYNYAPDPNQALIRATIVAPNKNSPEPAWMIDARNKLKSNSFSIEHFGNVEVYLERI